MEYPLESFTESERELLRAHFTNLDRPVFALVNLPETVKGALFARYSRYPGTLRRLFLDEFAADLPGSRGSWDGDEGQRAAELYERIFLGYGDDSVAQLGGAHVACEWVSNVLTKMLQRPRLGAYLEQSTRYIAYDSPMPERRRGGYRYYRDPELGPHYARAMDELFTIYSRVAAARRLLGGGGVSARRRTSPRRPTQRAIKAKALDLLRGLLPASSLSHMGIFATGQTYEQLILHLLAHPLPEARALRPDDPRRGQGRDAELRRAGRAARAWRRVDRVPRGAGPRRRALGAAPRPRDGAERRGDGPSVTLTRVEGDEDELLAALLFESAPVSEETIRDAVAALDGDERARAARRPRRHARQPPLPPRAGVRGAPLPLRDRRRLRRVPRPPAPPDADRPVAVADAGPRRRRPRAGRARRLRRGLPPRARDLRARVRAAARAPASRPPRPYALCLGYRIRFILDLNAREAMQLIELRSGREGHPSYRAVAHEMHAQIAAVHPAVAAAMIHVDRQTEPRLERILSEMRTHARSGGR